LPSIHAAKKFDSGGFYAKKEELKKGAEYNSSPFNFY
jgi:hypothetical protein